MSKLISGKEVLISLANGDEVEYLSTKSGNTWNKVTSMSVNLIIADHFQFRIKPKTIMLNGVEIPAPFKPEVGETFWYIRPAERDGYYCTKFKDLEFDNNVIQFGAWDSEDKIKEVVKAVRNVFNCGDNQC